MYTLYYLPGTCSMAVHALLNELGQPVKLVNVSVPDGQPRSVEFLKINPRGNVPVLVDGDTVIREGGAIISYLLDKHNSPMLPKSGAERAKALEWLMFANATMHPAYGRVFFLKSTPDSEAKTAITKAAIEKINQLWADVDSQLAKTPFVCGNDVSAADILLSVIANWNHYFSYPITLGDNVKRMIKAVSTRPAFQKALTEETVTYKAAA